MPEAQYGIHRGTMKILIPQEEPRIVVAYPFFGPANAKTLKDQIQANPSKLRVPTLGENIDFLDVAWGNDAESEFQEATGIMNKRYFRGFTVTHYDPTDERLDSKLVYVFNFPEFTAEGRPSVDNSWLVAQLEANSSDIRTLPKDQVREGDMTPAELAKARYLIALVGGGERADKVASLADKHKLGRASLRVPNLSEKSTTIATLYSDCGDGLNVDGGDTGYDTLGFALGVRPNADEVRAPEL